MCEPVVSHHHLVVKVWPTPKTARSVLCWSVKEKGAVCKEEDMFSMTVNMDNVWVQLAFHHSGCELWIWQDLQQLQLGSIKEM